MIDTILRIALLIAVALETIIGTIWVAHEAFTDFDWKGMKWWK